MWPILFFSVYAVALIVERWLKYRKDEHALNGELACMLELSAYSAKDHERFAGSVVTGKIATAIYKGRDMDHEHLKDKARNAFMDETAAVERHLGAISVIATLLPMLGLLGTVVGMIISFNSIALHGTGDPKVLANGISQALITTEAGLVASIPLIYLHQILSVRAESIIRKLDEFATHLTHIIRNENSEVGE
ncbi:MAG: MotA/TolQ/ExbB proton channel family protein [Nitrospinae bacterium]|nr:MotA/TolQ/ExbB proton channel family protein [Nitrospinota bacterium]